MVFLKEKVDFLLKIVRPAHLVSCYNIMAQNKQKKKTASGDKTIIVEGVSKKINKNFEKIVEQFEQHFRGRSEEIKEDHSKLCTQIEDLAVTADDCYKLFIGDNKGLTLTKRNPHLLLKYAQLFLTGLLELKKQEMQERRLKKIQNDSTAASYNPNNIYELVAKKNIQFLEMETQIRDLKNKLELATQRAVVAEEISLKVKELSDEMLQVYRLNYTKMSEFLKKAQQKETELLQSNHLLNQEIQTITMEFDLYKKNFKKRTSSADKEKRLRQRLQKQYQSQIAQVTKQVELHYRNKHQ